MDKIKSGHKILFLSLVLLLIVSATPSIFAEKIVSIQKTVNVDKTSLVDAISHLERYSQILPDYIQSSKLIGDDVGNMKIGLDWISIDTDIKFAKSGDNVILEVISGGFKDTKLHITMVETSDDGNIQNETDVSAKLYLQRSWHMGLLTSFVSDDDIESMLHTSLNGLEEYAKSPQSYESVPVEKEPFCILGLCF